MKTLSLCLFLSLAASCAGTRSAGDHMTSHAEAFNLFGMSLMGNDYDKAWAQVPEGANVISVGTSPKDWSSVFGILSSIMGVSSTQISWTE